MMTLDDALAPFTLLPDWEARFSHLIELSGQLPPLPAAARVDGNKVKGCTSQVWMTVDWAADGTLRLGLDSDAVLVKGLLALVYLAYAGKTRGQMASLDLAAKLAPTGLISNLSPNRRNGFASVLATLGALAA